MTSEIGKSQAVAAYRQMTASSAAAATTPSSLKSLKAELQAARADYAEQSALVETYVAKHGFKAFVHATRKADPSSADAPAASVSQAQPPAVGATSELANMTYSERTIMRTLTEACSERATPAARIKAMASAGRAAASFMDNVLGASGAQTGFGVAAAAGNLAFGGKGFAFIEASDLKWGEAAAEERFDKMLSDVRANKRETRDQPPRVIQRIGNVHPKTPNGFVQAARGMVHNVKGDYERAAMACRDGVEAAINLVAERTRASKDEIASAAREVYDRERFGADKPAFLLSVAALNRRGERAVRTDFKRFVTKMMDEVIRPEVRRDLEEESGAWVHPNVWQKWVQIAGAQPSLSCTAVKNAEAELAEALAPSADAFKKGQIVTALMYAGELARAGDAAAEAVVDKALDIDVTGPFTPSHVAQMKQACDAFADFASRQVAACFGAEPLPVVCMENQGTGSWRGSLVAEMIERANAFNCVCTAPFNSDQLIVKPGDSDADVDARANDERFAQIGKTLATLQSLSRRARNENVKAQFAEVSKVSHHTFDKLIGTLEVSGAVRALSDANSIAKFYDHLVATGFDADTVLAIRDGIQDRRYGDGGGVVPGTEPAWTVAVEKLVRQLPAGVE